MITIPTDKTVIGDLEPPMEEMGGFQRDQMVLEGLQAPRGHPCLMVNWFPRGLVVPDQGGTVTLGVTDRRGDPDDQAGVTVQEDREMDLVRQGAMSPLMAIHPMIGTPWRVITMTLGGPILPPTLTACIVLGDPAVVYIKWMTEELQQKSASIEKCKQI